MYEQLEKFDELNEKEEPLLQDNERQNQDNKNKNRKWWQRERWSFIIFVLICTEWGDVSQIAAIALAAKYGVLSVILGGAIAHVLCILIAIIIGTFVSKFISERWMNLITGILFILLAIKEIIEIVNE